MKQKESCQACNHYDVITTTCRINNVQVFRWATCEMWEGGNNGKSRETEIHHRLRAGRETG